MMKPVVKVKRVRARAMGRRMYTGRFVFAVEFGSGVCSRCDGDAGDV